MWVPGQSSGKGKQGNHMMMPPFPKAGHDGYGHFPEFQFISLCCFLCVNWPLNSNSDILWQQLWSTPSFPLSWTWISSYFVDKKCDRKDLNCNDFHIRRLVQLSRPLTIIVTFITVQGREQRAERAQSLHFSSSTSLPQGWKKSIHQLPSHPTVRS